MSNEVNANGVIRRLAEKIARLELDLAMTETALEDARARLAGQEGVEEA